MESALTNACILKIQNFEGPFDLLFHLLEKNQINIYDIPINEITDQYMEYLFAMQKLDLEIASEFLVVASTLIHIKSKMLLPSKKEKEENEADPREELVSRLVEYKKFKDMSEHFKEREKEWDRVYYKLPELLELHYEEEMLELSPDEMVRVFQKLLERNKKKMNPNLAVKMVQIIQHEKVSLKSKMRDIVGVLLKRAVLGFSELFSLKTKSKLEVVTGFMAMLELSKLKKVKLNQNSQFSEIYIHRSQEVELQAEDLKSILDD